MRGATDTARWISTRYPDRCRRCRRRVGIGEIALWRPHRRHVTCQRCAQHDPGRSDARLPLGDNYLSAGAAARRIYSARRRARRRRLRWLEPTRDAAWAHGARGERVVAVRLAARLRGRAVLLHDRRLPYGRANFDHIAIGPGGVTVIDTKNLRGRVRVRRRWWTEQLRVGEHDETRMIVALQRQVITLERVLARAGYAHVTVRGALCLASPRRRPWLALRVRGVLVASPERVARLAARPGPLSAQRVAALARAMDAELPVA